MVCLALMRLIRAGTEPVPEDRESADAVNHVGSLTSTINKVARWLEPVTDVVLLSTLVATSHTALRYVNMLSEATGFKNYTLYVLSPILTLCVTKMVYKWARNRIQENGEDTGTIDQNSNSSECIKIVSWMVKNGYI